MNQAVMTLDRGLAGGDERGMNIKNIAVVCVSALLVLVSALALVYLKDLNRREFILFQRLGKIQQAYQVNWGKLLLEQSAWSTQSRVQSIAQRQLNMVVPNSAQIVMLKRVS